MMLVLYTLGLSIWDGATTDATSNDSSSSSSSSSSDSSNSSTDNDSSDDTALFVAEPLLAVPQSAAVL
jgi:hypothetical protein